MKAYRYIALVIVLLLCLSACSRKGRVIPRSKMVQIYADMFLADQWIRDNPQYRKEADTTLFFEAVFHKYGYTKKDYDATVAEYVKDPMKLSKMLDESVKLLEKRRDAVQDVPDSLGLEEIDGDKIKKISER